MAKKSSSNSKNQMDIIAEKILERSGIKKKDWEADKLEKAKFDFLTGNDKELEQFVLNRAKEKLVYKELKKQIN